MITQMTLYGKIMHISDENYSHGLIFIRFSWLHLNSLHVAILIDLKLTAITGIKGFCKTEARGSSI